jgi:predicted DNA-binding transcriptional regulator AlpA
MSVRATSEDRLGIDGMTVDPSGVIHHARLHRTVPNERLPAASRPERGNPLLQRSAATDGSMARQGVREATQIETGREPVPQQGAEFISIPEWCRRVSCSRESGYRAARRDEIPGLFRIGRLKRVNWLVFVNATGQSNGTGAARP